MLNFPNLKKQNSGQSHQLLASRHSSWTRMNNPTGYTTFQREHKLESSTTGKTVTRAGSVRHIGKQRLSRRVSVSDSSSIAVAVIGGSVRHSNLGEPYQVSLAV